MRTCHALRVHQDVIHSFQSQQAHLHVYIPYISAHAPLHELSSTRWKAAGFLSPASM